MRHRLPGHAEVSRVNAHAGLPLIPGIYWPNLISASIPIETPHGSALGRRQLAERRRADARIDIRRTPGPESEGDKASRSPAIIMPGMVRRLRRPLLLHMPHPERTGASRKLQ